MSTKCFKSLGMVIALAAVVVSSATPALATLTLSMPTVTVLPGATSATAVIRVTSDVVGQTVNSINPALSVATFTGVGSATFSAPNDAASTQASMLSVPGSIWGATAVGNLASGFTATARKYSLSQNPTAVLIPNTGGAILQLTFALSNATLGDIYQVNLNADLPPNPGPDTTADLGGNALAIVAPVLGEIRVAAVPEPSSFALLGLIGGAIGVQKWFRRRRTDVASEQTAA